MDPYNRDRDALIDRLRGDGPATEDHHSTITKSSVISQGRLEGRDETSNLLRFVFGGISALLGILFYWVGIKSGSWPIDYPTYTKERDIWGIYLVGFLGAFLIAFAASQFMHLFWLADDENQDIRIWNHLSPTDRGIFKMRTLACRYWPIRIWCALSVIAVATQTVTMWPWIYQHLATIWPALIFYFAIFVFLISWLVRITHGTRTPDFIKSVNAKSWKSQTTWIIKAEGRSWSDIALTLPWGIGLCAYPFFSSRSDATILIYPMAGIFLTTWIASDGIDVWRRRKFGQVNLELNLIQNNPLKLDGKICFESPIKPSDRHVSWGLRFMGRGVRFAGRSMQIAPESRAWINLYEPVKLSGDGKEATFSLNLQVPENIDCKNTTLELQILRTNRTSPMLEFAIPGEAIFPIAVPEI
jgi:hypothetical protein